MNDFDFDELDKAVRTKQEHGDAEPSDSRTAEVPAMNRAAAPEPEPAKEKEPESSEPEKQLEPDSAPKLTPPKRPSLLVGNRPPQKSGRAFMDIVPPQKATPRVGTTLQPVSRIDDIVPGRSPDKPPATPEVTPTPEIKPTDTGVPTEIAKVEQAFQNEDGIAWPDPLDFQDTEPDEPATQPANVAMPESHQPPTEPEPMTGNAATTAEPSPVSPTPFLTDAKVEKRPLGAYAGFKPGYDAPETSAASPDSQITHHSEDELSPEANGIFKQPETTKPEALAGPRKPFDEPTSHDMPRAAMMSIPEQYRTKPTTSDQTRRPVFDAKEYHPPLLEAAVRDHHSAGMWLKLFIALVALALLGVAGYLAYLYIAQS